MERKQSFHFSFFPPMHKILAILFAIALTQPTAIAADIVRVESKIQKEIVLSSDGTTSTSWTKVLVIYFSDGSCQTMADLEKE
jgi:hypothetical protein